MDAKKRAYKFVQVDVFTDHVFGGNPLAVFLDGQGLSDSEMALIAKEMNLSETTFLLPPTIADCPARVRIFTPGTELPFAGHPTIGTSWVLATHGLLPAGTTEFNLQEEIGPIKVRFEGDPLAPDFLWMRHRAARFQPFELDRTALAAALGLTEADFLPGAPLEVGSTGVEYLYAPLRDTATVDRAVPNMAAITRAVGANGPHAVLVFAPDPDPAAGRVYSRMFTGDTTGIPEDPATGSAAGPLGAYLQRHGFVADGDEINILDEQGTKMGRQSFIHIRLTRQNDGIHTIEIGGGVAPVFEGTLYLDSIAQNRASSDQGTE